MTMGMLFALCLVMVVATFAPEIFTKATALFKSGVRKLMSLWKL